MVVDGLLHEAIDFFWYFFCGVKECLLLIVLPVQREVHDANCFPKVAELRARAVYDSSDLVGDYELQILAFTQKFDIENEVNKGEMLRKLLRKQSIDRKGFGLSEMRELK